MSLAYRETPISTSDTSALVNTNITRAFVVAAEGASLEVRAGYFGICVHESNVSSLWICSGDTAQIAKGYLPGQDPLNLIWASTRFKNGTVFSGLM